MKTQNSSSKFGGIDVKFQKTTDRWPVEIKRTAKNKRQTEKTLCCSETN